MGLRLGDILIERRMITPQVLERALQRELEYLNDIISDAEKGG